MQPCDMTPPIIPRTTRQTSTPRCDTVTSETGTGAHEERTSTGTEAQSRLRSGLPPVTTSKHQATSLQSQRFARDFPVKWELRYTFGIFGREKTRRLGHHWTPFPDSLDASSHLPILLDSLTGAFR